MAEVLAIVASGISVAQMAGQLVACLQQLHGFCRSMRDFPTGLQHIIDEIQILGEVFCQIEGLDGNDTASCGLLQACLVHCRGAVSTLETVASRTSRLLDGGSKAKRWHLAKAVLRKDEIRDLTTRLEASKSLLHLAMTCYSLTIQHKSFQLLHRYGDLPDHHPSQTCIAFNDEVGHKPRDIIASEQGVEILLPSNTNNNSLLLHPRYRNHFTSSCESRKCHCICHSSVSNSSWSWALKLPMLSSFSTPCNKRSCLKTKSAAVWVSLARLGIPYALLATLDISWNAQRSYIRPCLQAQRLVSWDSPAYQIIKQLRWNNTMWLDSRNKLVQLFESGMASPFDILPDGKTFPEKVLGLPWSNGTAQLGLVEMLVKMGAEINTSRILYLCAGWIGLGIRKEGGDIPYAAHKFLLNAILPLGFNPSEIEAPSISEWPAECSPKPSGQFVDDEDPFFVEWIAAILKVAPGFSGLSPLHDAILNESSEDVAKQLQTFSGNDRDNLLKLSPLHLAVSRPKHLKILLDNGANANLKDLNGRTPLIYAAAIGSVTAAISLIEGGANPWLSDNLYANEDFIHYALRRQHWNFVMKVLDFIRQFSRFTYEETRSLLNEAIVLWAGEVKQVRDSAHFQTLLSWGADPDIVFEDNWWHMEWRRETGNTLLHCLDKETDFDELVKKGFTKFNYENSSGAHALVKLTEEGYPNLLKRCIEAGSLVNHQDHSGQTALHTAVEELDETFFPLEGCQWYSSSLECTKVLLEHGADPFLGDSCRCACSKAGCTPAIMLLKQSRLRPNKSDPHPIGQNVWTLEWLEVVRRVKGLESARACLLDMIRLSRFEELELTHTCCRQHWYGYFLPKIEEEDALEIIDEEREIVVELERQMTEIEKSLDNRLESLDEIWIKELEDLLQTRVKRSETESEEFLKSTRTEMYDLDSKIDYNMDFTNDYEEWVEFERQNIGISCDNSRETYDKRMRWISQFRAFIKRGVALKQEPLDAPG